MGNNKKIYDYLKSLIPAEHYPNRRNTIYPKFSTWYNSWNPLWSINPFK
jgi:hypothetical protein